MAFCSNCGLNLGDTANFCSACGTKVGSESTTINTEINQEIANNTQTQEFVIPVNNEAEKVRTPLADEKYCYSCGSIVKKAAEICPKCGVNLANRNRSTAIDLYCTSCGKSIKKAAETCPYCRVSTRS